MNGNIRFWITFYNIIVGRVRGARGKGLACKVKMKAVKVNVLSLLPGFVVYLVLVVSVKDEFCK